MCYFNASNEIADDIIESIERATERKVFTVRVLKDLGPNQLELLIVFFDKSILKAIITITPDIDGIECRIQGKFL
jgi:hypothetical protein